MRRGSSRTTIDFITTEKTSSADLYERLARYCDEQTSKAVLGQTLTSDSGGGSYAQSKTHNDVRHDLTVADCKALSSTLRRDLIRPLCLFNFGEGKRIPYLRYDCEEAEDLTQTAQILGMLIEKGSRFRQASSTRSFLSRNRNRMRRLRFPGQSGQREDSCPSGWIRQPGLPLRQMRKMSPVPSSASTGWRTRLSGKEPEVLSVPSPRFSK